MRKAKISRFNKNNANYSNNKRNDSDQNSNNSSGFLPNSLRIINSCLKSVSANATSVASSVKSAAAAISAASDDHKEQVTWAGFDKVELSSSVSRHVLLLGYQNGFQVIDVDDASKFSELVSRRDGGPVTFLQMLPIPLRTDGQEGFLKSHPLLLVVGCSNVSLGCAHVHSQGHFCDSEKEKHVASDADDYTCLRAVHFYSLRSLSYVRVLTFGSNVCMVRCSSRTVAVGLAKQIVCYDALTLEQKFSVLTYPVPQVMGHEKVGVNIGCGPMAVGPRWLAYASNDALVVNKGRLSPQTLSPSAGASLSTSPSSGGIVAHYALESGKHLAAGIVTLGDKGYKTLSKYCHELLPDGSDSSQTSGSRTTGSASTEIDNAGVVVVKDLISKAMICQFRAHSTPISALCFDPSGTLLVTASVYGNSINVFRIMPCRNISGSASQSYNWSSSSVHLYKFRRGISAAVIQDICFSRYSQWIAVISSKGTCHVFVLSPFGGNVGFQNLNGDSGEGSIAPVLTLPWWSSSMCTINQQSFLPPDPVTLNVVTRIKDNKLGLLNTVSSAAVSLSGKASVPAGALAAVFHNSLLSDSSRVQTNVSCLEHLMVYTPSGHVVQHEIQPSFRVEGDDNSSSHSGSLMISQDGEPSISMNPVKWWDVRRRSNWSEREDPISETLLHDQQASGPYENPMLGAYTQDLSETNSMVVRNGSKMMNSSSDSSRWYISNAEVQYSSMRYPEWQKTKISFRVIGSSRYADYANGEYEIEKLPVSEVEIRRKDLLPVFDHFHSMKSALHDRAVSLARHALSFSLDRPHTRDESNEETVICHSKPASFSSTESSDGGSSRRIDHLLDLDHLNSDQAYLPYHHNANGSYVEKTGNAVDELSVLKSKIGALNITPSDFSRENSAVVVSSVKANIPASNLQSVSVEVISHQEPSNFHDQKGGADDSFGNGSTSSQVRDSVIKGILIDNALTKTFEQVAGLDSIEVANYSISDKSMDSRKQNIDEGFLCSRLSLNEEDCENTNKAEGRGKTMATSGAAASINPSSEEGDMSDEDKLNSRLPMWDFSVMESARERETTRCINSAATSCSTSYLKVISNNEEYDYLFPTSGICHTTVESAGDQRVSETASTAKVIRSCSSSSVLNIFNQKQDVLGGMLASSEDIGITSESAREQSGTEAANAVVSRTSSMGDHCIQQVEDAFTNFGVQPEDGMNRMEQAREYNSTEATSISLLSSSDSSNSGNLNEVEKANLLAGPCDLMGKVTGAFEQAACQKDAEVARNAPVSRLDFVEEPQLRTEVPVEECRNDAYSFCKTDHLNEDDEDGDDMLGDLFACSDEGTGNACSLSRKDDLNEVEDDMLGAIFPFSKEDDMLGAIFPFSEEAACQKDTEVARNAPVSRLDFDEEPQLRTEVPVEERRNDAYSFCTTDHLDEDNEDGDDMLGGLFACSDEGTGNACSLSRKDDLNEVEDDMLGAIFPFSEGLLQN